MNKKIDINKTRFNLFMLFIDGGILNVKTDLLSCQGWSNMKSLTRFYLMTQHDISHRLWSRCIRVVVYDNSYESCEYSLKIISINRLKSCVKKCITVIHLKRSISSPWWIKNVICHTVTTYWDEWGFSYSLCMIWALTVSYPWYSIHKEN